MPAAKLGRSFPAWRVRAGYAARRQARAGLFRLGPQPVGRAGGNGMQSEVVTAGGGQCHG